MRSPTLSFCRPRDRHRRIAFLDNQHVKIGVFLPQGWRRDLVDIPDPVEKY